MMNFNQLCGFFSKIGTYISIGIVAIIAVICLVIMLKFKHSRKLMLYIIGSLVIISGLICGVAFYKEVTAKSYVNGSINIQNQFSMESFRYGSNSVVFYHDTYDDSNTYTYSTELLKVDDFNGEKKNYEVVVNDYTLPATVSAGAVDTVLMLDFYSTDGSLLCSTQMKINIKFLSNKTQLTFLIIGEKQAQFLEQYFRDYGIRLRINEIF